MARTFYTNGILQQQQARPANATKAYIYGNKDDMEADASNIPEGSIVFTKSDHDDVIDQMKAYIRNQNVLSDWENFYTYNNNSWNMTSAPFDGYVIGRTTRGSQDSISIKINNVQVGYFGLGSGGKICIGEISFKKGDSILFESDMDTASCYIRFYNLRDYSDRT